MRNLFFLDRKPATSIPTISHFSPLPSATECQSTFLKVDLQLFGESRGEGRGGGKENTRLLLGQQLARRGGSTRKVLVRNPPFIFSPHLCSASFHRGRPFAPLHSTPFSTGFHHLIRENRTRFQLNFLFGVLTSFSNYFDPLEMSAGQRGRFKACPFNNSSIDHSIARRKHGSIIFILTRSFRL